MADDKEFPIAHANQVPCVWVQLAKNGFELDVECYTKQTEGGIYALLSPGFVTGGMAPSSRKRTTACSGARAITGHRYPLKKTGGNYSGWLAYTLSKTTQNYREINRNVSFFRPRMTAAIS